MLKCVCVLLYFGSRHLTAVNHRFLQSLMIPATYQVFFFNQLIALILHFTPSIVCYMNISVNIKCNRNIPTEIVPIYR